MLCVEAPSFIQNSDRTIWFSHLILRSEYFYSLETIYPVSFSTLLLCMHRSCSIYILHLWLKISCQFHNNELNVKLCNNTEVLLTIFYCVSIETAVNELLCSQFWHHRSIWQPWFPPIHACALYHVTFLKWLPCQHLGKLCCIFFTLQFVWYFDQAKLCYLPNTVLKAVQFRHK